MNLTSEQQVTKAAVIQIYSNAKLGIAGHAIVIFLLGIVFYSRLPFELLAVGLVSHVFILLRRTLLVMEFDKINNDAMTFDIINKYLNSYRRCMLFSGFSFGLLQFSVYNLSIEYHFFILAVLIGLSSGAIFTLGEVLSIYLSYLLAMIGISFMWFLFQNGEAYTISLVMLLVSTFYSTSTSRRYAENFRKMIIKEQDVQQYIYEQKEAQEKIIEQKDILNYRAHHDILTDLPNRVLFHDRLNHGIQKAMRNSNILALCFIDLDNFKIINDSLGHDIGDKVLKGVTKRLSDTLQSHDTLARWGGDEFTIIIENIDLPQDASIVAQKILDTLKEPFLIGEHTLYVTSSIGISIFPKDSIDSNSLIKYADSAMYKAKDEGKNNFKYYSDYMTKMAFERVVMESSIRAAISKKEFVVYYQPQINAKENKLIGMEALVRWNHPTIGLIQPFKFIPIAEETGLVVEIDKLVMDMAMKQFSSWFSSGYNLGTLSLNLAVKHLEQENYVEKLQNSIKKYSLNPDMIELEVTESDVMKKPEQSIEKLNEISKLGIRISIDDFGTGYSSLSYLKKLPIDKLKIDKSFIDDIPNDADGEAIVKAIIAMTNSLGLTVIAEGVEEEEQKEFLVKHNCHNIQGYYYSKPIPSNEMLEFMKGMNNG